MSLSIGIIGLPNVGKSTLFNALLKRQQALVANYPFATIEPNIGIVDVPDPRLYKIAQIFEQETGAPTKKITPTTVKFVDIAGLVKGAAEGQGLGNKFLSHIREVGAIAHVLRDFEDENIVREGSISPDDDMKTIETELILADLQTMEKAVVRQETDTKKDKSKKALQVLGIYKEAYELLNSGKPVSELLSSAGRLDEGVSADLGSSEDVKTILAQLNLLTIKPVIYIYNVGDSNLSKYNTHNNGINYINNVYLCAKIEAELSVLAENEQLEYLNELGIAEGGLDKVIRVGYKLLNLQTFFTQGPDEIRAWTIKKDTKAPQAAGEIHTDFEKSFIKADVISYVDLLTAGSFKKVKELGLLRLEGKEYVMQDGDIVEYKIGK